MPVKPVGQIQVFGDEQFPLPEQTALVSLPEIPKQTGTEHSAPIHPLLHEQVSTVEQVP